MKGQKKQFIIKEKRNKRFIQIINTLFTKYPLLKLLKVKYFENKTDSKRIRNYRIFSCCADWECKARFLPENIHSYKRES